MTIAQWSELAVAGPFDLAALEAIEVQPQHALFVGDRVREDYDGPRAVGMRAVIFTAHAEAPPPEGIPTITSLTELAQLL